VLRQMTEGGRGLVFISHKIHEVLDISDRITVLRGVATSARSRRPMRPELAWWS